ncbi:MAG: vWA domain-containing protein [Syntrophobacteraceae bacterium]
MFSRFFFLLRQENVPVTPTSFLRLHKALHMGLIGSMEDFYTAARSILIKSERHFDLYDRVFAHHFEGAELKDLEEFELSEIARALLEEWLQDPQALARELGIEETLLKSLKPEELLQYFLDRLKEQTEAHHGGHKWIGTGGTSPVGHSGYHPGGMRVGGSSGRKSAVKVAMERRYRDYSQEGPLTQAQMAEALKRLRNLVPVGPKDLVNVEKTIYQTMKKAGEIEIVFDRSMKDRLKVILALDNGGWSMDPYVGVVQTLFNYARAQFKDLKTFFFHNTVYDLLWEDPPRWRKPFRVDELIRLDPETRFIFVGDASMSPYELNAVDGSITLGERTLIPSYQRLEFIAKTFPRSVWLNPVMADQWSYTQTIGVIRRIFPMFELTIDGLESAIQYLMRKN